MSTINKVAVIGAGVMGAGIAAQIANAGVKVLLLDIVPPGSIDRNILTHSALKKLGKSQPPALMHPHNAQQIFTGNTEDHLDRIAECDWIIEAVLEDLKIKQTLFKNIEAFKKPDAVVSSNTSTLPLSLLTKGMSSTFCEHFLITHFFNPPRYMRLLEIVSSSATSNTALSLVTEFADRFLGKSVVNCHDTPGFIANRIGAFWIQLAVTEAIKQNITAEQADAILGKPAGVPKTGIFGLIDLIGLDLMPKILKSLKQYLPQNEPFQELPDTPEIICRMIQEGYIGRKGKGGFYRLNEKRQKEVISLKDGNYSLALRPRVAAAAAAKSKGLRGVITHNSQEGRYAWSVLSATLAYCATLVPEITDDIESVDRAMRLGYNWKYGPFELIDKIGAGWFSEKLAAEGRNVPQLLSNIGNSSFYRKIEGISQFRSIDGEYQSIPRPQGVLLLSDIKQQSKPILTNRSASLWNIGDGVACLEFHSKMNSINLLTLSMIANTVKKIPKLGYSALVIHNEGQNFSVGANLLMLMIVIKLRLWPVVRKILSFGQQSFNALKFAPFPVVGAPSGMALGGGCEVLLHCDAVCAHAETYVGLVEAGVGFIPGWGGCKELLGRWTVVKDGKKGPMAPAIKAFETIVTATVAKSAMEAKDYQYFRHNDKIVMNKDRLLFEAKKYALQLADGYKSPAPYEYNLAGPSGLAALKMAIDTFTKKGIASEHDAQIGGQLAQVLTGAQTDLTETLTENDLLQLEQDALIRLAKTTKTKARIEHMLKTGKPLRN